MQHTYALTHFWAAIIPRFWQFLLDVIQDLIVLEDGGIFRHHGLRLLLRLALRVGSSQVGMDLAIHGFWFRFAKPKPTIIPCGLKPHLCDLWRDSGPWGQSAFLLLILTARWNQALQGSVETPSLHRVQQRSDENGSKKTKVHVDVHVDVILNPSLPKVSC